jgi:UDP-N-acetylglucosamine 2-epimerase
MAVNADGRFRGEGSTPLEHAPDWLIVPDVITREAYERLGYPGERISVCGHPHYDHVRRKAQQFSSRDPAAFRREVLPLVPANKMVITFVCEPRCALNPALTARSPDYKLLGNSGSDFRGIIVLEELIDALELCSPRPALVVRLHPKNVQSDFAALAPKIDLFSSGGDPLEVVWASDLIVGMSSTLLLEAALLGKPVISIVPRDSDKSLLVSTAVGLTACLSSREQIRQVLSDFVAKQSLPETSMTHSEFFEPGALKRVQEFVSDLLNQSLIEFSDLFEDLNLSITMSEDYQRESSALRD